MTILAFTRTPIVCEAASRPGRRALVDWNVFPRAAIGTDERAHGLSRPSGGQRELFSECTTDSRGAWTSMHPEELQEMLCKTFCTGFTVTPTASGFAVGSTFADDSGDRIGFFLSFDEDLASLEDDGSYLSHLVASDIAIDQGTRGQLLDSILDGCGAYWDRETYEIRTLPFPADQVGERCVGFLSGLIRVRDLELLTRNFVRSTFREDALIAVKELMGHAANIDQNVSVNDELHDFPADIVIRPNASLAQSSVGAVYLVSSNEKLNEALLLRLELMRLERNDLEVIALLENQNPKIISSRHYQRAQNRGVVMPIFRMDERESIELMRRSLRIPKKSSL
ncbi:DUF1828 domain-containing protein [Salinarimonas sp. NSM]|uniref:DUF1828 domain-containing protein n=1 Tax=Salinarimonas sp. NSM TaxID=3458003 RepID=UPI004036A6B4